MSKISELAKKGGAAAKAAAVKKLDQNADGRLDREDARQLAVAYESRFPLGVIIVAFAAGAVLATIVIKGLGF